MQPIGRWRQGAVLGIAVAAFAALRLACLRHDLWLDEIWSLQLVGLAHSPLQLLTRLPSENNHPLNSLWLYLLGPAAPEWSYRLLSWATGSAAVGLAGLLARRQFQRMHPADAEGGAEAAGWITVLLFGGSYLFVLYSSEARGYAPALGFSLLAGYVLLRAPAAPVSAWAVVYWLTCVLGLLAHAVSAQVVIGGLGFSLVALARSSESRGRRAASLLWWHALPVLFLACYFLLFFRHLVPGGATFAGTNHVPLGFVFGDLAAFSLGFPVSLGLAAALPVLLLAALVSLGLVFRRDRALATFYALAVFLTPLPGIWSATESVLFPRFFFISAAGALLLIGYLLARAWSARGWARPLAAGALGLFLLGSGLQVRRLLTEGRGEYREALRYAVQQTPGAEVTVSTDFSEFRNSTVIAHYGPAAAGPGRSIRYLPSGRWRPPGPAWLFVERIDHEPPAPDHLYAAGVYYQLERVFPHAPLSGWDWYLYRNTLILGFPPVAETRRP
jgi:hypothetical protein